MVRQDDDRRERRGFENCAFGGVLLFFLFLIFFMVFLEPALGFFSYAADSASSEKELRGVWFSYLDWNEMPKSEAEFKERADRVMTEIQAEGMNAIFCHVHSHSDSYGQKLRSFPASRFMTTKEKSPSFDPLAYMIESAHRHGLRFHAWVNPYRVSGYLVKWADIPESSIVKKWAADPAKKRNVLFHGGEYYLNPSSEEVRNYLTEAIRELCANYDIDGVQFDDYFYPALDDSDPEKSFDKADYESSGSTLSLSDWRRDNVSKLVLAVHRTVHEVKKDAVFGVSPVPLLSSLRSEKAYFVDIDRWMSSADYVDYIMPQIYHGFEAKTGKGTPAKHAYAECLASWVKLKREKKSPVKLMVGLALYKAGTKSWDGNSTPEWLRFQDILAREVRAARESGEVQGFGIFDYQNFDDAAAQPELQNLRKVFSE